MPTVTSSDVEDIVSKLSSDKARTREEGIKLLNTWLDGERSTAFCKFLSNNTALLKPNRIPQSNTWPFLITLLINCVSLEVSSSKRRLPKLMFAKTLRSVIQKAESTKTSGNFLHLLSVIKPLINHVSDVLREVPSFHYEYGIILRHLLAGKGYRFHMRKKVYSSLVLFYMEKVEASLSELNAVQCNPKEEIFRSILCLHSLLDNPPGDFPNSLREDIIKGFIMIFSFIRDEGKISRELIKCINTYLVKDGPNLGCHSLEIHSAVQQFVFRCWLTTHDKGLKDALILYARAQLNLIRGADGSSMVEQFMDVVFKELDQSSTASTYTLRRGMTRDDKSQYLTSSQHGLVELAAAVFYRACTGLNKSSAEKRARRENASVHLKEGLTKGRWLWSAAFCCLVRRYFSRSSKDIFMYCFEAIRESFRRILDSGNMDDDYDCLLWNLRCLQELASVRLEISKESSSNSKEVANGWQAIWSCLLHALPRFSNITSLADAALNLLGNIISNNLISTFIVPQDVWDLQLFKRRPTMSLLFFISCYFSTRAFQGDVRDILHLRQNLLRAVCSVLTWKDPFQYNAHVVLLLPAAVYSLCTGFAHSEYFSGGLSVLLSSIDASEAPEDFSKADDCQLRMHEQFDCCMEVLSAITSTSDEAPRSLCPQNIRLPRQIRDPLLLEAEADILVALEELDTGKMVLSAAFFLCALLSNSIYLSCLARERAEGSAFVLKLVQHISKLLDMALSVLEGNTKDIHCSGHLSESYIFSQIGFVIASAETFMSSPLFAYFGDRNALQNIHCAELVHSLERLLTVLAKLYDECLECLRNQHSDTLPADISLSESSRRNNCQNSDRSLLMDMDLDISNNSKDVDILAAGAEASGGVGFSTTKWKLDMISLISTFFSVLPDFTWEILFDLMGKESKPMVTEKILYDLCRHPHWTSSVRLRDMVNCIGTIVEEKLYMKLPCFDIISAICDFIGIHLDNKWKDKCTGLSMKETEFEQSLKFLGDLVNKVGESDLLDWSGRIKLIDCICNFISFAPEIGQTMIRRLLMLLHDPDYRVRIFLARRVCVLFQTWDGHDELFYDICSNFGVKLVSFTKTNLVTAAEVLAAGSQPSITMETIVITLIHIAFCSEKVEIQAVFMTCAVAAMDPCQRELVTALLESLSRRLQYTARSKYFEEIMGSILFYWVACGVSLAAFAEIRSLFGSHVEAKYFLQFCCSWLLPALIIHEDISSLKWIANVTSESLEELVQSHFVPIFSICMALHCSKEPDQGKGSAVLQKSILSIANISENERDSLIKKHLVSIVGYILSLASCISHPTIPVFSSCTITQAIRTVVDGFLDMEDSTSSIGVVDKINIFRPDRVFMFIVEMHYKITSAVHYRHKCHRLAGVEVLVNILGYRAAVSSTSCYLFNLVGQYISCSDLQDQCCRIISSLIKAFQRNPTKENITGLGEQLQFLVSKLVACCIPPEDNRDIPAQRSSPVLSLLHQLTVESDPSLHDYVKELEPFPELDIFYQIRKFQDDLCIENSPRDHFLKFVKRSCYLPPRLLLWSLKALHKKLLSGEIVHRERETERESSWSCDNEVVHAVWTLVRTCGADDAIGVRALVSDFISRVGLGDPHSVVFHLPGDSSQVYIRKPLSHCKSEESCLQLGTTISDELVVAVIRHLKKYLMDDSVRIIDMASQALRGILSTERGQRALQSFNCYERSIIEVHSKGINVKLVEKILSELERKFTAEGISLENSDVWKTLDKTFEMWICPLVYSLIGYCSDIVLRLCQDIVFQKSEAAEVFFPIVLINLSGRKNVELDLQKVISFQVQENVFVESNKLLKSIQVWLDALNELRAYHLMEKRASTTPFSKETAKLSNHSSYSSKSRSTSTRAKGSAFTSGAAIMSTSLWDKVYWLSIDYLTVAKFATSCGSYFTSVMYVEYWCEEQFKSLTLGNPDFSPLEMLPCHVEILVSAVTKINEPDSLYGINQSHKLTSQIITYEHEGNWNKALEYYDLQVRSETIAGLGCSSSDASLTMGQKQSNVENEMSRRKPYKGLIRSLQQIGCTHLLDLYCQGLASRSDQFQHDLEFTDLQYEAAWRAGNWDFSLLSMRSDSPHGECTSSYHSNENLYSCLRALQEGDYDEFQTKLKNSKQELVMSVCHASEECTEHIFSTIVKLQIFHHLGMAWDLRWTSSFEKMKFAVKSQRISSEPVVPTMSQMSWMDMDWSCIVKTTQRHMSLLEPFIAFRRVLLQILNCQESAVHHLLQAACILRKGTRYSLASAALHELKFLCTSLGEQYTKSYWLGRVEEAKLLHVQGRYEMAINLAKYVAENSPLAEETSDVLRLVGKWLAETRSSNSRTILEKYLKHSVSLADDCKTVDHISMTRQSQSHFHLAHYADALLRNYEERLASSEWQAAMRLRKHKTLELEALIRRLKSSTKGEKTDYSIKIQELQKQLTIDKEEAEKIEDDRDNFLSLTLEGYKRCLVLGDKYDVRVVFRLVSLWFSLSNRQNVVNSMLGTIDEVQSYKFIPLMYQIASRMGSSKDGQQPHSFQFAVASLVKRMAIDHPYHTILQLLALANGDRIKDKQRSRNSFVVDMDKKLAAENLLKELVSYHGAMITQTKQMVEVYIKLAELETKREDTNKRVTLPRDIRSLRKLELVPVVTSNFTVDRSCQYHQGSFPHFLGLEDSVMVMNGINAPKVAICLGSDGQKYRQLAKSGNDDLRQDAVMEQFFGLVNTFLRNHRGTWKRRLGIRTYKVVPFTPSAGVLEWVDGTLPLGEYLIGSMRNGGAHGRYGAGDWSFLKCREHMANVKDKRKAFQEVCENFRPVMHHFFLERFLQPADWFEKRLAYTRSVAASSMVGYIVGLGDRHSMNILIDQTTAEVVHIDLGVAFEQGLMLKTPERIPFRLTRDIIGGMGITGVEGVFRRCCEETLSVMRTNKEALLTIVEVFIHDPLYKWALSPLKALRRQKDMDDDLETLLEDSEDEYEGNKDAARALMRVKQKLDGYEDGEMRSVNGQVQQLIQDAIDPERLCQLFPGWGAWL